MWSQLVAGVHSEESQHVGELEARQQALHHVGAVQAVHAVRAEHAALSGQHAAASRQKVSEFTLK